MTICSEKKGAGLYVHVPFCRHKCRYCDFYSLPVADRMPEYGEGLLREISLAPEIATPVASIYFGGGTPSLLSPELIHRIIAALHARYPVLPDAEITLEANPGTVTREQLSGFLAAGVNRLNFGVQSFDKDHLQLLGRIHSAKEAIQALEWAGDAGFMNIGLDLIYGLPGQDLAQWRLQLETALDLHPSHLSCYLLSFEPGTPLANDLLAGNVMTPDERIVADLLVFTLEEMDRRGYPWYEVSNFAKSASLRSRHNQTYWEGRPYLGFGPAAHGFYSQKRYANHSDLNAYLASLAEETLPIAMEETLGDEERRIEFLYLSLRTRKGISISRYKKHCRERDFRKRYGALVDGYVADGQMEAEGDFCRLTPKGMVFLDTITAAFVGA